MENQNTHIDDFLDYYCNLELPPPQYAVMLKGKWGSGKTHYINEYKKKLDKKKQKYLYISLYGVTSYDEIETKFLEQLHPQLYNKKTILARKIAKGFLRATLKIDLDDDGKDDGTVNSQVPNLSASDLLNTKDYILIFDDLERCSININDLLGYINYFVEHQDYRVILLANDEKFKDKDEYKDIKEKLIGKIFEVVSNTQLAYDSFIENIKNQIFMKFRSEILEIYRLSEYNNLRVLRQIIFDFDRFYKAIELNTFKDELVKDLVQIFFILAIESRLGKVILSQLSESKNSYESLIWKKDEEAQEEKKSNRYYHLICKYGISSKTEYILDFKRWNEILENSLFKIEQIKKELLNSKYYLDENSSSWKKLWYFKYSDNADFRNLLTLIESELENKLLTNIWEIRHICSLLLHFSKHNLYSKTQNQITKDFNEYIDYLFDNNIINHSLLENFDDERYQEGYDGLGYVDEDNEYSKKFLKHLAESIENYKQKLVLDYAIEFPNSLKNDSSVVKELFTKGKYSYIPIFHLMDIKVLIDEILVLDYYAILDFGYILRDRYRGFHNHKLIVEIDFLLELKNKLELEQTKLVGTIQGYKLNIFIEHSLTKAIQDLERHRMKQQGKNEH